MVTFCSGYNVLVQQITVSVTMTHAFAVLCVVGIICAPLPLEIQEIFAE